MSEITLKEITAETLRPILNLKVTPAQEGFVAPNAVSVAEAHFNNTAWFRGIYFGQDPVGFAMLSVDTEKPEYYLWRFMIAADQQGKGYGAKAIRLLVDHVRTLPRATKLETSYVPGEGSPQPFYEKLGFKDTGEVIEGEHVMILKL